MAYTTQDIIDAYNQTVGAGTMSEAEFVQLAMSPQYNVTADQLVAARDVLLGGAPATTGGTAGTATDTTGIASINTTTGAPVDTGTGISNINATGITTSLPSTTAGTLFTEFGDQSGWNVGATSSGNPAFVRGNDYVVSDEIYWNPNTPLGENLTNIVQNVQDTGGRAGLTITPYAMLDNKATAQDLLNEVKRSGVDFVALDPYLFGDNRFTAEQGIEWTRQAVQALRDIGVDVKLVTQGFVPAGMTDEEIRSYNAALSSIPGVSEVVNFGLEDAPDLQGGGFRALSNPLGRPATVTGEAATTAQDTTLRYTPTTVTDFNRVLQDSSATASDIVAAYNYAVNNPNTSTADKQALQTFAPNIQEFERLSNIGYVKDYENTEYNPLTIVRLADQISRNLDLSSSTGGVFGTKRQSVGFDYGEATRLLGTAPTTVQQVALDMARELARKGITDISQLTTGSYTAPDMELESGSRPGETTTQVFFGDELLGSPTTKGNFFGATYTGEGGTAYNVDIDPQTGKPRFYTSFIETSDRGTIGTLLSFATLAFPGISQAISGAISGALPGAAITGGAGAAGAAAGIGFIPATTFNTVATQALTSGIMSGLGAVVAGGDFEDGFKSGFISGGAGGVVKAVMPTDFAATNPRLANTISSAAGSVLSAAASGRDVGNALTNSLINSAVVNGVQTATGAMGLSASDAATISRIATPIITSLVQTGQASEQTIINAVLSAVGTMAANQSNPTSVLSTLTGSGRTGDDLGGVYERDITDTLREAGLTEDEAGTTIAAITGPGTLTTTDLGAADTTTDTTGGEFVEAGSGTATEETQRFNLANEYLRSVGKTADEITGKDIAAFNAAYGKLTASGVPFSEIGIQDLLKNTPTIVGQDSKGRWVDSAGTAWGENGVGYVPNTDTPRITIAAGISPVDEVADTTLGENSATVKAGNALTEWANGLEGTSGEVVRQTLSTIIGGVGEQVADIGTALSNMGISDRYNALVKIGQALEQTGQSLEIPGVAEAKQKFWESLQSEGTYLDKLATTIKTVVENPLALVEVAKEVGQEGLPLLVGGAVFKVIGKLAGVSTDVVLNAAESMGATSREKYRENIASGMDAEQAERQANLDGWKAFGITAATMGITDAGIAKKAEKAFDEILGRVTKSTGKEFVSEGFEEGMISWATGDDLNTVIAKSLGGSLIGGKTSGSIQATADTQQIITDVFAKQGLTSTDGSFRSETIVPIGTTEAATSTIASDAESSVSEKITSGADATTTIEETVSSSINSGNNPVLTIEGSVSGAINAGAEPNIVIDSAITSAVNSGFNVDAATAVTINSAVNSGVDINAAIAAATNTTNQLGSNITINTSVNTEANTTTTTVVNSETNTKTTVTTNSSTGVTTTTETNTSTNVTTTTEINSNTNTQTTVTTNPNLNTETTVTTDLATGESTKVTINTDTGEPVTPPGEDTVTPPGEETVAPPPPDEEDKKPPTETPPPPAPTLAPPKAPPPAPKPPGKPTIPTGNLAQLLATLAQIDPWYADIDVADLEKLFSGQTPLAMPKKKEKG